MSEQASDADRFMAQVERIARAHPQLTQLQAALVAAALLGIAHDSRSFARMLGLAHALVLRELNALAEMDGFVAVTRRDARTMRTFYAAAAGLLEAA